MHLRAPLLLAATALTLLFSSCVREYTCQCWIKYNGQPGLPDSVLKEYPIRDTKKKAESLCQQNSTSSDKNGIHTEESCDLY